jgi:hypothetical protein
MNMIEMYHFFRYNQNKARRVKNAAYNENYWKNVTDINNHFKKSIFATVDCLTQINVSYFTIVLYSWFLFLKLMFNLFRKP